MHIEKFYKYKNWYSKTRFLLIRKYKKDYRLFAGLLSATSPRFQIKRNFNTANNIYYDFIKDKQKFLSYFIKNKNKALKKYKILYAHYNNIIRVLSHNYTNSKKLELGGLKVNSFYNNLIGNYYYVTIDVWILRYFKHKKPSLNKGDYICYTRIITKLSKKLNLYPCELQAVIWEKIRYQNKVKPSNFHAFI